MLKGNEKAYIVRKRRNKTKAEMAKMLRTNQSRYSAFERGDIYEPDIAEMAGRIYDSFVYAKPLLRKEKFLVLKLRKKDLYRYIPETMFWSFYNGIGFKKNRKMIPVIIQLGQGLFTEEDFDEYGDNQ